MKFNLMIIGVYFVPFESMQTMKSMHIVVLKAFEHVRLSACSTLLHSSIRELESFNALDLPKDDI